MIRDRRLFAAFALTVATAAPTLGAQAQTSAVSMSQLSTPERPSASTVVSNVAPDAASSSARRSELASAPAQVGDARRTAEASPEISTLHQGRAVGVTAVGGHDRCDTAHGAERPAACDTAIETRAGDYGKPVAAPVTAEGRLLILTQPGAPAMTPDSAARRLGGSGADLDQAAGSAAGQLAAVISQSASPPDTVPNGGNPSASPVATVLSPGGAPMSR